MTHALTLELPEQVYETLMKAATRQGQRPEAVAIQWLATASESQLDDPFEQFIGAFSSNVPDWADRHDEYLRPAMLPEYDFSGKKGGAASIIALTNRAIRSESMRKTGPLPHNTSPWRKAQCCWSQMYVSIFRTPTASIKPYVG
jgi:hypothetical protein